MSVDDSMDAYGQHKGQHKVCKENEVLANYALTGLKCDDDGDCRYCLTPIAMFLSEFSKNIEGSR